MNDWTFIKTQESCNRPQPSTLYSNQDTKTTIDSIQNFYESFCRPSPESQALDLTDTDLQQMAEEENETIDTNEEGNRNHRRQPRIRNDSG
jgi:hypothetical protein